MKIVVYEKPTGVMKIVEEHYENSRSILNRYTVDQLKNWKSLDLYFILGIDSLRNAEISQKLLKNQYRKQTLKYHPDKGRSYNEAFIAIQKAYKTLSNEVTKRRYDSVFFDESIPKDRIYDEIEFFRIFGPVFKRNSKFSVKGPIPHLGDMNSTLEEIEDFYKFWRSFESWRSFEFLDEEDTEGLSRSDKRYVEKKNKNRKDKLKREDTLRIKALVEMSIKRDPRLSKSKKSGSKQEGSLKMDPKLLSNRWNEEDIQRLIGLMDKIKVTHRNRWIEISRNFNLGRDEKKEPKEILIKCNEIGRIYSKK
ncbi:zuotin-like [Nylanderia fulva]|uniref:zuotin-like n=1 Tax=Nylanderia fulva TaxID=613905 RepID=UPI0010FBA5B2|nr:zuotin-like [Nylanderia fulva]